jgi:ArsR family transcriptional regulator
LSTTANEQPLVVAEHEEPWREHARLLGVMAHPVRLAVLDILCEQPRCVKDINALVPLAQSHLSQHLSALRKADLVASLACGALRCYYVLRPTLVQGLIRLLREQHPLRQRDCRSVMQAAHIGPREGANETPA